MTTTLEDLRRQEDDLLDEFGNDVDPFKVNDPHAQELIAKICDKQDEILSHPDCTEEIARQYNR